MTVNDFSRGDKVRYIPLHAKGDRDHKDCEDGIVFTKNADTVFVKYISKFHKVRNSYDSQAQPQGTDPNELIHLTDAEYGD